MKGGAACGMVHLNYIIKKFVVKFIWSEWKPLDENEKKLISKTTEGDSGYVYGILSILFYIVYKRFKSFIKTPFKSLNTGKECIEDDKIEDLLQKYYTFIKSETYNKENIYTFKKLRINFNKTFKDQSPPEILERYSWDIGLPYTKIKPEERNRSLMATVGNDRPFKGVRLGMTRIQLKQPLLKLFPTKNIDEYIYEKSAYSDANFQIMPTLEHLTLYLMTHPDIIKNLKSEPMFNTQIKKRLFWSKKKVGDHAIMQLIDSNKIEDLDLANSTTNLLKQLKDNVPNWKGFRDILGVLHTEDEGGLTDENWPYVEILPTAYLIKKYPDTKEG
jgi:hypothetical protein